MAQHNHYWSCTKFADWIRGTPKLKMGTGKEWDEWYDTAEKAHPIRYWIAENALDAIQNFITFPVRKIYDAKYYINNRWVTRTHCLTAHARDIRPGSWCDVGNRFLPCLFNELVDFVEVELAWWHIAWADKDVREKYKTPFWAYGWFRWRTWRCPQAGLDNLEWQRNLRWSENECEEGSPNIGTLTYQAIKAQEILDLYTWWTTTYRNRPDPYDASGWTEYCELNRLQNDGKLSWDVAKDSIELQEMSTRTHEKLREIEESYEKEDEEMMIRLIKIRQGLWT
jgi:hypothetical protein